MVKLLALLTTLLLSASQLGAQVTSTAQNITVQVSTGQSWTDTGLDLQSGDELEISASASSDKQVSGAPACDPKGVTGAIAQTADLPIPTAPAGALIARLHAHGASPLLVGASTQLHISSPSHLMLGMNISGTPPCQGDLAVKVHVIPAGSTATSTTEGQQKTRGEQLKSQLATAAQVFMSGQFGMGKPEATSNATSETSSANTSNADAATTVPPLKVSDTPFDADLRKSIDSLPRRVNDQFQNLGDMVNFVIVGDQKDVQAALDAATWHVADTNNQKAVLNAFMETY